MNRYHSAYMSMTAPTASDTGSVAATRINYNNDSSISSSSPVKKQVRFNDNIKSNSDQDRIKELGKRMSKEQEEKFAHNNAGTHSLTYSLTHLLTYSLTYLIDHLLTYLLTSTYKVRICYMTITCHQRRVSLP